MRLALAAGGVLLLALLTWLLLRSINTNASAYAEAQRAFDDFALAEASISRDALQARAGLLGNYDVLVAAEEAMESAVSKIRLHVEAENIDPTPVDRLAAAVAQYAELTERFKSGNSLLQNSLSYVSQLSTDPAFGALSDRFAPSATALAAAVLRLARDSSVESASSLQQQINRFEAQAPIGGPDGEAARALIAHALLLSGLLPDVDRTLRALVATPGRLPLEETRAILAHAQAASELTAQRFRLLLYLVSLVLLIIAVRLGLWLRARTLKIRRLVDANIIGIFVTDLEGRIFEANDAFLRIVGYDREDLVSGRVRRTGLTPPEWRERDERALAELRSTGSFQPVEKEYFRKDGSRVPVLVGAALFKESGEEGVAFVLDLTERKRAEERLRVQHTVAQILAEAATIEEASPRILRAMGECLGWDVGALWRVDREAEALRCVELWHKASIEVPEFERVSREFTFVPGLGLPGRVWSSLEPDYIPDVVPDENFPRGSIAEREGLHAAFGFPILLGGEVLGVVEFFSREIRQPDQELLDMLATIGSQIGQFIERKRAEEAFRASTEALRRSEERWRTVFQNAPVGIGTLNLDGPFVTANPTFQRMLGYGEDELRSLTGLDITHEDDRAATRRLIDEMMAGGRQSYQMEKRYRRKDGQVIWVLVNTSIIPASGSTPAFFAGVVVDMEERKRAQEERERLRQLEADLAHMNRVSMMGELAASLAHEITQPVGSAGNNARAALNFLDKQPPDLGEAREAIDSVVGDADRAGDIIDRIREQIKKAPPRKGRFALNAAINEVIVLAHSAIVKNGVSVETRLADGLLPVLGDRVQVQQVVLNLVLNAVEAMGSVEAGARELSISTEQTKTGGARVAVRDSGPGIDAEHLERVFQAFYTTKSSGTGMGLSICRSIIDAHGGRLWAEANDPRGAVFQFSLPGAGAHEFSSGGSPS
jgi:PAS domain S-box-containing protein